MRHPRFEELTAVSYLLWSVCFPCCSRAERRITAIDSDASSIPTSLNRQPDSAGSGVPIRVPTPAVNSEERTITFAWKPANASAREYPMSDPEGQHRILLTRGVENGNAYAVVVALHGQPRRGQAPRSYVFPRVVSEVTRELVQSEQIEPLILVTPVFRFEGENWPNFELVDFMAQVRRIISGLGLGIKGTYVVGHSGAAGCGGGGLNRVSSASPNAVGFFDTCVGAGFVQQVLALAKQRIPTLIIHSVETAGFQPRQPIEYDANFDFGKVYSNIGLRPATCPARLPEAPLRQLTFRCATNNSGTTLALVLDTGQGEKAHEALVPVALRFFLREYLRKGSR